MSHRRRGDSRAMQCFISTQVRRAAERVGVATLEIVTERFVTPPECPNYRTQFISDAAAEKHRARRENSSRGRVAAVPARLTYYSAGGVSEEAGRGGAAAATWMFRGGYSAEDVSEEAGRGGAAAATRIYRGGPRG